MPITIKLQDIDEAIENLRYKNETTLKSRLLRAVRQHYIDDASAESLQAIDAEQLVKTVWETGDDRDLLKAKRKNFSSLKSSVNSDLKKLYAEGKNPQGIVIGHDNIFGISDEAKDKALSGIMDVFKEKGIDTQSKIGEILSALSDILSSTMTSPDIENTKEEIDRLKNVLGGISGKLGLSMQDIIHRAATAGRGGQIADDGATPTALPGKRQDLSGYVHGELSMIDQGLQGLAMEAAHAASGAAKAQVKESVRAALNEIVRVLKDAETDAAGKAKKIMAAVEGILAETMDAAGGELPGGQAGQLKEIFRGMTEGAGETAPSEATPAQMAGGELLSKVSSILGDGGLSAGDKISRIMSSVNEVIGEALTGVGAGLSDEDKAHIRGMLDNITGNLSTLAQDSLAGFEIIDENIEESTPEAVVETAVPPADVIEEIIEDGAAAVETVEVVEEIDAGAVTEEAIAPATDEAVEIAVPPAEVDLPPEGVVEDIFEEVLDSAAGTEDFADELELAEAANADLLEEIAEANADELAGDLEEIIEIAAEESAGESTDVMENSSGVQPESVTDEQAAVESGAEALAETEVVEEIIDEVDVPAGEEEVAAAAEEIAADDLPGIDEAVEVVVEIIDETAGDADAVIADDDTAAAEDESVELVEVDAALEGVEEILDQAAAAETGAEADAAEVEVLDQSEEQDVVEEIDLPPAEGIEETGEGAAGPQVEASDKNIDADLREKTELLTRLAEAAGALEAIGPDLNSSIYTEEEIRGKAKLLSEEFDRYLSIRDRFYNAHILIKGGDYLVGGAHLAKSVLEEQIVTLQDFYISKFPVTNGLFEIFVEQTGYITTAEKYGFSLVYFPRMQRSRDPITGVERFSLHNQAYSKKVSGACWHRPFGPGSSLHLKRTNPVVQVSWEDARAFAIWTGKRLPTEIEWEAAARTERGNIYPWGNEWQEDACNIEKSLHGDTTPVDQYAKFANVFEVADMLGNVLEWTSDVIGDKDENDQNEADTCIVKGASWISHHEINLTDRHYIEKSASSNILGFRCVAI